MNLTGIMSAIVTPLTEAYTIDESAMKRLIDFQIERGINSLLVLGGTGEYSALTMEVREQAVLSAVKYSNGRIPVIVGVLEPGIGEATKFALKAKAAGADAILVVTPYYIHPDQEGMIDWYKRLDAAVNMPMLIYNIPYRTYVNIQPEAVKALADACPNIIGIKECSPNLGQAIDLIRTCGDRITVLSGEEFLCTSEILLGMKGGIMASANLVPDVWVEIYKKASVGKNNEATEVLMKYYPLFKLLFKEINPGPLKYALSIIGLDCGPVASPLHEPSDKLKKELKRELTNLGIIK
ncbi:4-hydroxy-tetrahydrodipicolinate synthase [Sedimentibacter hydroxybenzoicus DSM 7310]|uniref:4-hydroxy-tetrahydrodipicolinate synthase n=1 Tax=Sedimentibacter hydroxybenzoicus DSM 7310 TaxID=1123245 RepID=A0A974BM71_SEDHY|nr:4-hydroxy-tetrahydrodipicolinate synthase [Sedimentibacter hydroxybenzoicus]NYB75257.1 4-hydroxy-tetrahydrodipicolinate synthase [Sedimentibacter hydroxybenzoicus DSM 7310]